MNRKEFSDFCRINSLRVRDAGSDWRGALVNAEYSAVEIRNDDDFNVISDLLDQDICYIASCKIKAGNGWYEHDGDSLYCTELDECKKEMRDEYERFLRSKDGRFVYYSDREIAARDALVMANPKADDEEEDAYLERLESLSELGFIVPFDIKEAGYYDENNNEVLLCKEVGIFSYSDDNWTRDMVAIFKDQD